MPLQTAHRVRIVLANGAGGFVLGNLLPTPRSPSAVRALDFNLDGLLDLVATSQTDHVLAFHENAGLGTFATAVVRPAGVRIPTWMMVADFDSDARTDVAVVPDSTIDADPPGVLVLRNTNCRARQMQIDQEVSTCDLPDLPFSVQPAYRFLDGGNNDVRCEERDVTASIFPGTGSPGASLIGNPIATPDPGVGIFQNLGVDQGGPAFRLQLAHPEARRKLTRTFTVASAPTIQGPLDVCQGDPAFYSSESGYGRYEWHLDFFLMSMAPAVDLTSALTPGPRTLDLYTTTDNCVGVALETVDVTAPLSGVSIAPAGPLTVCDGCTGPIATSNVTGGGGVTYQWGYRTTPVTGSITPLSGETNPTYTIEGADFGGVGVRYLVLTVTPACGAPMDSNDIEIDVQTSSGLDPLEAFTALATNVQVRLEFSTTMTGICDSIRILRNDTSYPMDPNVTVAPNLWIGGADFPCPGAHEADFTDPGVSNDQDYFYSAWVKDGVGGFSAVKNVTSTPFNHTVGPVKWAYSTGATSMAEAGLRISGGQVSVYAVSNDSLVHALTGDDLAPGGWWLANAKPYPLGLPSQVKPPVVPFQVGPTPGGAVFVTSQDGTVSAINATSMSPVWNSPVGEMVTGAASGMFTSFGGAKNLIFVGTRNTFPTPNEFRAYDVDDGSDEWSFSGIDAIGMILGGSSVDYAGERVFFGSRREQMPETIWALDVSVDGSVSLLWSNDIGEVDGTPVFLSAPTPRVVVGTNDGTVDLLDAATGNRLWPSFYDADDGRVKGFVFPHTHAGARYYMFSTDSKVTSILHNGDGALPALHWQLPFTSPSTPIWLPGTTSALVGSGDGRLYLITGVNTSTPLTVPLQLGDGSAGVGTPTFDVVNRVIYVGTEDGVVRAITYPFP